MSNLIKRPNSDDLQAWGISPDAEIVYYDGKVLVTDDSEPDSGIAIMTKTGCAFLFGVAVFTHAPVVGITMFAYGAYKVLDTVRGLYGGSKSLSSRLERDLVEEQRPAGIPPDAPRYVPDSHVPQQIGQNTRLGAIEVQSQSVTQTLVSDWQNQPNVSINKTALDALLASPYTSRAFFGAQRTGKSYLAAVASFELAKTGVNVFHINLMSYGEEDAYYWQHAKRSIRCDLPALSVSEGRPFIKSAIAVVAEFVQTPNSLLIIDEWAYIASTATPHRESLVGLLNEVASQIASLSSAGIKRQRGLWTIAPEFVAGGLVPQGKAVKKLQLVYATIHPDRSVDWNGHRIGFSDELYQQVVNNFSIDLPDSMQLPNCDRICYINREWMPVGELPQLPKLHPKASTVSPSIQAQKDDETITFPISEIAALRGIDRPQIETDEAITIETKKRPESLDNYPMVKAICLYLEDKEPRSLKQISDVMKKSNKVTEDELKEKLGTAYTNYREGVLKILFFGVSQKLIKQISQDSFTVNY